MPSFDLGHLEKQSIQSFMEEVQALEKDKFSSFASTFPHGNKASWRRFVKGAVNHPITWWIGILQLQMQTGLWGHHYQAIANSRASELWQISKPLRNEVSGLSDGKDTPILSMLVRYNFKYKKADILGRLVGSQFTKYASTGSALGKKRLSKSVSISVAATNFSLASYGAAIKSLTEGQKNLAGVIQSVLTGSSEGAPKHYNHDKKVKPSEQEIELLKGARSALDNIMTLSQLNAGPVPLREFCTRPENIDLKGVCK